MKHSKLSIAAALAALTAPVVATAAVAGIAESSDSSRRLTLNISQANKAARPEITVVGSADKYDRVETSSFGARLSLGAHPANGDEFKIVRSRLFLKADGQSTANDGVDTLADTAPSAAFAADGEYVLPILLNGPIAQNAVSLCNAVPYAERNGSLTVLRTMALAVAWHVTTGRFSFKWTNYDRVAPSDDILRNPDFYAEQTTQDAETLVDVAVACAPLPNAAVAAKAAADIPVRRVALTSAPIAQPEVRETAVPTQISQADVGKPRCDGGMVRQISTAADDYLCLCPGNTKRMDIGDNAFACERRTRR